MISILVILSLLGIIFAIASKNWLFGIVGTALNGHKSSREVLTQEEFDRYMEALMTHEIVRVKTKSTGAIKLEEVPEAYKERFMKAEQIMEYVDEKVVKINIEKQVQQFLAYITEKRTNVDGIAEDLLQIAQRKRQLFQKRSADIVKATADVSFMRQLNNSNHQEIDYQIHFKYLIKHKELFYIEEEQL
ncbi:DUF3600 domain-containing protein, partial [Bacillus sp. D-CC]